MTSAPILPAHARTHGNEGTSAHKEALVDEVDEEADLEDEGSAVVLDVALGLVLEQLLEVDDDDDGGCGAARRRLGAGWRAARATLLAAWPCLVALLCVPPCHPAWVLAQTAGIALGHLCRATGYEIHVFPHED